MSPSIPRWLELGCCPLPSPPRARLPDKVDRRQDGEAARVVPPNTANARLGRRVPSPRSYDQRTIEWRLRSHARCVRRRSTSWALGSARRRRPKTTGFGGKVAATAFIAWPSWCNARCHKPGLRGRTPHPPASYEPTPQVKIFHSDTLAPPSVWMKGCALCPPTCWWVGASRSQSVPSGGGGGEWFRSSCPWCLRQPSDTDRAGQPEPELVQPRTVWGTGAKIPP